MASIEIIELTDSKLRCYINKIDVSMANSLRRILIAEIPTMAVRIFNKISLLANNKNFYSLRNNLIMIII